MLEFWVPLTLSNLYEGYTGESLKVILVKNSYVPLRNTNKK